MNSFQLYIFLLFKRVNVSHGFFKWGGITLHLNFFTNIDFIVIEKTGLLILWDLLGPQLLALSYGAVVALHCQETINSTSSRITRSSLFIFFEELTTGVILANNKCRIGHTTSTGIEKLVAPESLEWAQSPSSLQVLGLYLPLHTMLLQIFSSFLKIVYLQISYFGFNPLKFHMAL